MLRLYILFSFICLILLPSQTMADRNFRLAVTTSFNNSGLAKLLIPELEKQSKINIDLIVAGTGQALKLGQNGDVDAVFVHAKQAELNFIKQGYGIHRRKIMYNDFIIIGPQEDPASLKMADSALECFENLHQAKYDFISRGDDSGTHLKEKQLWNQIAKDPLQFQKWYKAVGAGTGTSLNIAAALGAYALVDRASWLNFKNKQKLAVLCENDAIFFNQYSYIPISKIKHAHIQYEHALIIENWLTGSKSSNIINNYKIKDQQLFYFNGKK